MTNLAHELLNTFGANADYQLVHLAAGGTPVLLRVVVVPIPRGETPRIEMRLVGSPDEAPQKYDIIMHIHEGPPPPSPDPFGRLTIALGGRVLFDDTVDELECNHHIDRQIDPLDLEPKRGSVTLKAAYAIEPKRVEH